MKKNQQIFLAILVVAIFTLVGSGYCSRPERSYKQTPSTLKMEYDSVNITTTDGKRLTAWLCKPAHKTFDIVMIFASQDAGNMSYNLGIAQSFVEKIGIPVLLFDYRGFGTSDVAVLDSDCIAMPEFTTDIYSVVQWVQKNIQPDTNKIVLYGRSMGASLALTTGVTYGQVGGIIAESPYVSQASLCDTINSFNMARGSKRVLKFLPLKILEPLRVIHLSQKNILLLHGQDERFISSDEISELYHKCPSPKKSLWIAAGANHLELPFTDNTLFLNTVYSFISALATGKH